MITLFLEHEIANDHLRNKKLTGFCMSTLQGGPRYLKFFRGLQLSCSNRSCIAV